MTWCPLYVLRRAPHDMPPPQVLWCAYLMTWCSLVCFQPSTSWHDALRLVCCVHLMTWHPPWVPRRLPHDMMPLRMFEASTSWHGAPLYVLRRPPHECYPPCSVRRLPHNMVLPVRSTPFQECTSFSRCEDPWHPRRHGPGRGWPLTWLENEARTSPSFTMAQEKRRPRSGAHISIFPSMSCWYGAIVFSKKSGRMRVLVVDCPASSADRTLIFRYELGVPPRFLRVDWASDSRPRSVAALNHGRSQMYISVVWFICGCRGLWRGPFHEAAWWRHPTTTSLTMIVISASGTWLRCSLYVEIFHLLILDDFI